MLDKKIYNILRYIDKNKGLVPYEALFTRFRNYSNPNIETAVDWLNVHNFIRIEYSGTNEEGLSVNPSKIKLTIEGKRAKQEARFITLDYVLKYVIVPLTIGALGSVLSEIIKKL